jgi:hypothetical protein
MQTQFNLIDEQVDANFDQKMMKLIGCTFANIHEELIVENYGKKWTFENNNNLDDFNISLMFGDQYITFVVPKQELLEDLIKRAIGKKLGFDEIIPKLFEHAIVIKDKSKRNLLFERVFTLYTFAKTLINLFSNINVIHFENESLNDYCCKINDRDKIMQLFDENFHCLKNYKPFENIYALFDDTHVEQKNTFAELETQIKTLSNAYKIWHITNKWRQKIKNMNQSHNDKINVQTILKNIIKHMNDEKNVEICGDKHRIVYKLDESMVSGFDAERIKNNIRNIITSCGYEIDNPLESDLIYIYF